MKAFVILSLSLFLFGLNQNQALLRQYALEYEPTPEKGKVVPTLNQIPENISQAFQKARLAGRPEEKSLVLIFAKLYRAHLFCCHQSYEIRTNNTQFITAEDPMVFEVISLIERYPTNSHFEFLSSGIIMDVLEEREDLLDFEPIRKEYDIIQEIRTKIANGDIWKD